jgi:phosphatidyl-myo-inositol dimannoside synthase
VTDPSQRSPLRTVFVSHSFPPEGRPLANVGGMQRVATELSEALAESPEVALRRVVLRSAWRWTGPLTVPFLFLLVARLPRIARAHRADVVVFSSVVTALVCWPLRRRLRRQGVATAAIVHGLDVTTPIVPYQWLVRRAFRALDLVLPVSRATAAACIERGLAPAKVRVVPNGVSVERFLAPSMPGISGDGMPAYAGDGAGGDHLPDPDLEVRVAPRAVVPSPIRSARAERQRLAERFGASDLLAEDSALLCSVGRHVPRKGFDWFVSEVMPGLPAYVQYWLAGEGPTTEAIREAAEAAGVANRVRILGCVSEADLRLLLRASDLLVMPNRPIENDVEGFGIVMLEAGLCGTPSVAAALDGIRDVIVEGESGHLVTAGDPDAFAEVIRRYSADRAALAALSRRAQTHTLRTFNWAAVADRYVEVLSERVGHRQAVRARAHAVRGVRVLSPRLLRPAQAPRPASALAPSLS